MGKGKTFGPMGGCSLLSEHEQRTQIEPGSSIEEFFNKLGDD